MKTNTIILGIIAVLLAIQTIKSFDSGGTKNSADSAVVANPQQTPNPMNPMATPVQTPPVQTPPVPAGPVTTASYGATDHDFGTVKMGSKTKHTFKVTNAGLNPLTYSGVTGDAGLTIVSYPTNAIAPGGSGEIVVEYSPDAAGPQTKQVHVNANTEPAHVHLVLNANVQ